MSEAVIVSAVRVPTGKFLGTLKDFPAPALGAMVVREVVARAGIDPAIVITAIEEAVLTASRKSYGKDGENLKARLNYETGEV